VEWLIDRQRPDGRWDEDYSTGTGFPRVFYLKYHLYRNSFPVLALAAYRKSQDQTSAPPVSAGIQGVSRR
jgi:squalene-hopene/tetraprenyl-beta-curcumene cyclase